MGETDRLRFFAYDRSCDLHPFLCNLDKKGVYLANFLLKNVKCLVDRFHVEGHTERCCLPPTDDDPGRGCYHPANKAFAEIKLMMLTHSVLNSALSGLISTKL